MFDFLPTRYVLLLTRATDQIPKLQNMMKHFDDDSSSRLELTFTQTGSSCWNG